MQITFAEDLKITEMISGEGEKVPFTQRLYPEGNVEDWLLEVEVVMRESLRQILSDSLQDYTEVCQLHRLLLNRQSTLLSMISGDVVALLLRRRTCDRGFESWLGTVGYWLCASYLHLCASVTKQYNLVPAKRGDLFGWESNSTGLE